MSWKGRLAKWSLQWAPGFLTRWAINHKVGGVAKVLEFRFDRNERKLFVKALLAGEAEPVEIRVEDFELWEKDGEAFVMLHAGSASRPWMDALLRRFALDRPFRVPRDKYELLQEVLA